MNKVILMGRLARDPDVRTTQTGRQVARMTIAVDRRISRASVQPGQQTADFINLVAWERTAEFAGNYLRKGTKILVEGRIQARSYDANDGSRKYVTEVVVDNIEFAESKAQSGGGGSFHDDPAYQPTYGAPPPAPAGADSFAGTEVTDDDIPF